MLAVAAFVNHVLAGSPVARARLGGHAGKCVRVEAPPLHVMLRVTATGGVETAPAEAGPDVSFRIDAAQMPQLLADPARALQSVHLSGDAELAQAVAALLREVRWDVEEDLSRWIGDVAAHRVAAAARAFFGWGRAATGRLADDTASFLTVEEPLLVHNGDFASFESGVAMARDAAARLEKRLERLEASPIRGMA